MTQRRHIRIFISSPGDVSDERNIVRQVIQHIMYDPNLIDRITIRVVAWDLVESSTPMLATMPPQAAINRGLPRPSECDIVIVIFWSRMGTPLPYPEYQKENHEPYWSGTEWEYLDALRAAKAHGVPQVIVYRRNEGLNLNPDQADFDERLQQYRRVQEFFNQFRDSDGALVQGYNQYDSPDTFRQLVERHLRVMISTILESAESPPLNYTPSSQEPVVETSPWIGSPFPGLRAFEEADAPIFFGRGNETDALLKRLTNERFIAVVAASGAGKSSLIAAGLIPRLRANAIEGSKDWRILPIKPGERGNNPFEALYDGLLLAFPHLTPTAFDAPATKRKFIDEVQNYPQAFAEVCGTALKHESIPAWSELLLFVDQFEELFTVTDETYRKPFIDAITHLGPRVRLILTIRADFYHLAMEYPALADHLRNGSFALPAPRQTALYDMITRPASRAHLTFEDGLVDQILDDSGHQTSALPLMAYALDELYNLCKDSGQLTFAAYNQLGGVSGAISKRAESTFLALPPEVQAAHPHVFHELVEIDRRGTATRKRAPMSHFDAHEEAQILIRALVEARLLMMDRDDRGATVEVAHEALLHTWQMLADWIEITRDDLRLWQQGQQACLDWERHGRSEDYLWTGEQLQRIQHVAQKLPLQLTESERHFLGMLTYDELIDLIHQPGTSHKRRLWAGEKLTEVGDPQKGVGLNAAGQPEIDWLFVPGAVTSLRDNSGKLLLDTIKVDPFFIGRYLITQQQFQAFIDSPDGYNNDEWWVDMPPEYVRQPIRAPGFVLGTNPRESVTWYQCVAFCRWLDATLSAADKPSVDHLQGTDWQVRLPTEWEWYLAATGGNDDNLYPWGQEWASKRGNTAEGQLGRVTAVGMYPAGASPVGALDMIGNVWEWCLNGFHDPLYCGTGRHVLRGLRGGAFSNDKTNCTTQYRYDRNPSPERDSIAFGFRVVYAPACAAQS